MSDIGVTFTSCGIIGDVESQEAAEAGNKCKANGRDWR